MKDKLDIRDLDSISGGYVYEAGENEWQILDGFGNVIISYSTKKEALDMNGKLGISSDVITEEGLEFLRENNRDGNNSYTYVMPKRYIREKIEK